MDITPLQNLVAREWVSAVERDGFRRRKSKSSHHIYQHLGGRRVLVVYHSLHDTFGAKSIRQILRSTHWTEEDLGRLRLIA